MVLLVVIALCFSALSAQTTLISPTGDGGFETATDFAGNGWTVVNPASGNLYYLGNAPVVYAGDNCAYTSSAATPWAASTTATYSHIYRDITFPAGEGLIKLNFYYKIGGTVDAGYDGFRVYIAETTYTPITTGYPTGTQVGNTWYDTATSWTTSGDIYIPSGNAGTTKRVIITWRNDGAAGYAAGALDNISLTSEVMPPPLTGTKTIHPTTGDYTSFTAAIAALNMLGIGTGGVTFNVAAGLTFTESNMIITATGTAANPIVFQKLGEGANPIIYAATGTGTTDAIITLRGTDYLTWDGIDLYENAANTTSTTQMERALYVLNNTATDGAQYNVFRNFTARLNRTNTSARAIYQHTSTLPSNLSGTNSNNEYNNITIENSYVGIWLGGYSTTWYDDNTVVRYCTIGAGTANDIGGLSTAVYGIYSTGQRNILLRNNIIRNLYGTSTISGLYIVSNLGDNNRIFNNKIYNLAYTSTSTSSNYGIYLSSFTTGTNDYKIYNNMIWGQTHGYTTASTTYVIYGIYVASGGATNTYNIDFNSIRIEGPANASNAAVYFLSSAGINKLRNNVLANFTGGHATPYHLGIYSASATALGASGSVSNNNVIHIANSLGGYAVRGSSTNYATIAAWTTASGQDGNSRPSDPLFVSASDLHIQTGVPTPVESKGAYLGITWVTNDIDANTRYGQTGYAGAGTAPDIGADEGEFTLEQFCETPTAQPTSLALVPYSTAISGSFTAASPAAEKYLVVRSTAAHNTAPTDAVFYSAGNTIGNGTVVQASSALTFNATGLTNGTLYYFTIYSYNDVGIGAPKYLTTSPLSDTLSTLPAAPAVPAAFTATTFSGSQINLAATANASSNPVMVAWNTTNTFGTPESNVTYTQGSSITGGGTVYYLGDAASLPNHSGLTSGTTYYYRIWSYVQSGSYYVYSSSVLNANATTLINSYPYTQNFDGGTASSTWWPDGWAKVGTSGSIYTSSSTSYNFPSLPNGVYIYGTSSSATAMCKTPTFETTIGQIYRIKFKGRANITVGAPTEVGYLTNPTDGSTFQLIQSHTMGSFDWTMYVTSFTATSTSTTFAFKHPGVPANSNLMDDVEISLMPTYPETPVSPSPALAAVNQSIISNLGWTNEGTVTKIDVYFSTDSTLVETLDSSVRVVTNQTSPLNAYDLPVLDWETLYYWRIVCKNDADPVETATSPLWYFTTMADPSIALPWTEGFATTTWPTGWSTNFILSSTSYYGNPQPGAYKYTSSVASQGYMNLPLIGPIAAYTLLAFDYKLTSSPSTPTAYTMNAEDSVNFYVSVDYGQTFALYHSITQANHTTSTNWVRKQIPLWGLDAEEGDKIIIRIENLYKLGSHYFQIDNFEVSAASATPLFSLTPTSWNFGNVDLTKYTEKVFEMRNSGAVPLTITGISLADTTHFKLRNVPSPLPTLGFGETANFTVRFEPAAGGLQTTTLTITDDQSRNTYTYTDSLSGTGLAPVALPYTENFDGSYMINIEPANSWVVGTPAKTTYLLGAYSTPNAAVTRSLTALYDNNENSYLTLPTLDISHESGVITTFWHDFEFETGWDGGVMEYSTDMGTTWAKVDPNLGTGVNFMTANSYNWYNSSSTSGPLAPPKWSVLSTGFAGHNNGWIQSATFIPRTLLGAAETLKLRFNFKSDGSGQREGWAIDDIAIYQQPIIEYALSNMTDSPYYKVMGDTITFGVTVTNNGYNELGRWVRFKVNNTVIDSVHSGPIATLGSTVVYYQHIFSARDYGTDYTVGFELPADELLTNNQTQMVVRLFNPGWLAEGFEGTFLPSRWIKWGVPYWNQTTVTPYDGTKAARVTLAVDSPGSYLGSPRLTIATGDSLIYWAKSSVAGMTLQLKYNSNADSTATWTTFGTPDTLTTEYVRYAKDLSALNGEFERFAFLAQPNGVAGTIYLDRVLGPEIYIPSAPPGPAVMLSPADLSLDINPRTVVLDWNVPLSGGDPESYIVLIGQTDDIYTLIDEYDWTKEVYAPDTQYQPYPEFMMDYSTEYYWAIVPSNSFDITDLAGVSVWKFTTQPTPLTGNWTINPNGTGGTNFTNWTDCINYLNAYGVGDGGVTISVYDTTYVGPFPAITYNATENNPVTFQTMGSRQKPVLMAGTGTGTTDAIIRLNGADYITFDGFDIKENPLNADATTRMEYGIYITNNGATDGAKNNTIKNCDITLSGTSVTRGVYQLATSVTTAAGSNSYNKFYDNTLLNCWFGYNMVGSSTVVAYDVNTEIGGITGGSITNALQGVAFSYQNNIHIYKQTIVLLSGTAPTAILYGINTALGASNSMDAYDNTIYMSAAMTSSYTVYGISMTSGLYANIYNNVIRDFTIPTTFYGINLTVGSSKQANYIYNNQIYNVTMAAGTYYGINCTATHVNWIYGNQMHTATVNGSSYAYPLYVGNSATTNLSHVHTNVIRNITTTGSVWPYLAYLVNGSTNFYDNQIHTCSSTSTTYPIYSNLGVTKNIYNNQVYGITVTSTSTMYGIYLVSAATQNVYDNRVYNLSGGGTIAGIYANASLSTASTYNIHRNKVYGITYSGTSTSICYGIYVTGSSTQATVNVFNNMVSDLWAPAGTAAATSAQVQGITTLTALAINLWHNSVHINASSTGTTFSTAALFLSSGVTVDLRNNIFVNKSIPGTGTARSVAFWKGATGFTNVKAGTDKNIYYAGDPSAKNLIYYDTSNTNVQTLAQYKALNTGKDQNSYSENTPFEGGTPFDCHIDWDTPTVAEGNALVIAQVPVDIDLENRATGDPGFPDIGADEFPGTPLPDVSTPLAQATNLILVPASTSISGTFDLSDATNYLVVRHVNPLTATPIELKKYAAGDTLGTTGIVVGNVSSGAFDATGLVNDSLYYFTIFANNQNAVFGPKYLLTAPLSGSKRTLPAAPNAPATLTASSGGSYQINLAATANANGDSILVAWNTVNAFGNPSSVADYLVDDPITGGGTVLYIGTAAGLPNHTGLNPNTIYYYKAWSFVTSDVFEVYSATGPTANAMTWAVPVTSYPFLEGFESGFTNGVALGAPYTQVAVTGTGNWTANSTNTTYNRTPRTGSFNATLVYGNTRWLFRPFQLTGGVEYTYKMYARQDMTDPSYANMTVAYGNAPTDAAMTNVIIPQTTIINGDYQLLQGVFTPSATGTYMIGIKGAITSTPWYISIDDISLRPTPTVPETPEGLTPALAAVNQSIGVNLAWANVGPVTKIDVYFGTDSTLVYNLDSSVRVATNQTDPLTSYDLPVLDYSTRYFWQIVCKDDLSNTAASGLYYFNTMADPSLPVPYTQDFGTVSTLPTGWTSDFSVATSHGRTGSGLYRNIWSSAPTGYATIPQIGPIPNATMLKFDYRFVDYTNYATTPVATVLGANDSLNVNVSKDGGVTFTQFATINGTNHTATLNWNTLIVPMNANGFVTGDRIIIRFNARWDAVAYNDYFVDIDNVEVYALPNDPLFVITPDSLNWGDVQISGPDTRQFVVTNGGVTTFNVTSVYVEGGNASEFQVNATGLPATVVYNAPYSFTVTCNPLTTGTKTTTLKVVDSISGRVINEIPLVANAVPEAISTPVNLAATVTDYNNVALTWSMNSGLSTLPYVGWSSGPHVTAYRATDLSSFDAAAKFTTSDINRYDGYNISKIKFWAPNYAGTTYKVRIWTGSDANLAPTTMVVDQTVATYTQNAWNEITLTTPYTIDSANALWIGYNMVYPGEAVYPVSASTAPSVIGKGLLDNIGGTWVDRGTGSGYGNLNVQAYLEEAPLRGTYISQSRPLSVPVVEFVNPNRPLAEADPRLVETFQTRALEGFNVYRNNVQINTSLVPTMSYNDLNVTPNGDYSYYVEAVYATGNSYSNTISVNINKPAPLALPFTEDWASSSFDTQLWNKVAANWVVSGTTGNPAPGARFNYNPISYNYTHYLTSWEMDGLGFTTINLYYDIRLDTNTTETVERMAVEVFDGTGWNEVDVLSNSGGDFAWTNRMIDISSYASDRVFKIRFKAFGSDSGSLNWWAVDNINIQAVTSIDTPEITIFLDEFGAVKIDWEDIDGAAGYIVYGSDDAYADFPSGWTVVGNPTASEYNPATTDLKKFYIVTATTGARQIILDRPAVNKPRQ